MAARNGNGGAGWLWIAGLAGLGLYLFWQQRRGAAEAAVKSGEVPLVPGGAADTGLVPSNPQTPGSGGPEQALAPGGGGGGWTTSPLYMAPTDSMMPGVMPAATQNILVDAQRQLSSPAAAVNPIPVRSGNLFVCPPGYRVQPSCVNPAPGTTGTCKAKPRCAVA